MQRQLLKGPTPFYQNISGGRFMGFSDDDEDEDAGEEDEGGRAQDVQQAGRRRAEPFSVYTPQIYPHLMPHNIAQAQAHRQQQQALARRQQQQYQQQQEQQQGCQLPRSTSGGSVLV